MSFPSRLNLGTPPSTPPMPHNPSSTTQNVNKNSEEGLFGQQVEFKVTKNRSELLKDYADRHLATPTLTHKGKEAYRERLETVIRETMNKYDDPEEKAKAVRTIKLIIKMPQESMNHNGNTYSIDANHYNGGIDKKLFEELSRALKHDLSMICIHTNAPLGNRKLSFYATNYTKTAKNLREWLENSENFKSTSANPIHRSNTRNTSIIRTMCKDFNAGNTRLCIHAPRAQPERWDFVKVHNDWTARRDGGAPDNLGELVHSISATMIASNVEVHVFQDAQFGFLLNPQEMRIKSAFNRDGFTMNRNTLIATSYTNDFPDNGEPDQFYSVQANGTQVLYRGCGNQHIEEFGYITQEGLKEASAQGIKYDVNVAGAGLYKLRDNQQILERVQNSLVATAGSEDNTRFGEHNEVTFVPKNEPINSIAAIFVDLTKDNNIKDKKDAKAAVENIPQFNSLKRQCDISGKPLVVLLKGDVSKNNKTQMQVIYDPLASNAISSHRFIRQV
ncbi:MAG: hypothetical protein KBD37_03265 [Burkholderiales bacterium]|nr:hypothetical protein [Burkholderiales bacterium]